MSPNSRRDASFVVRIWWERSHEGPARWRGQVIHAESRQPAYFGTLSALFAFLEQWVGDLEWQGQTDEEHASEKQVDR